MYYAKLDPFARKQALQGMGQLLGGVSLTLWLAKMAGADVGVDPRSADFAKIKLGDTRIDIAGGFQQYLVLASRIVTKETVSSTTGEVTELEGGFAKPSRWQISGDFLENKLSPVGGYVADWQKNENFSGDPFAWKKELGRIMLPLGAENAYEGFKSTPAAGVASVGLGSIGFGTQTYAADPVKAAAAKERAKLAKRGPVYVRRHEDDMATLREEAKRRGVTVPRAAVEASRRIRNIDEQLARTKKKKGDDLTYQERAKIVKGPFLRTFPDRRDDVVQRFGEATGEEDWERLYDVMRRKIRETYSLES